MQAVATARIVPYSVILSQVPEIHNTRYMIQHTRYKIQDTRYNIQIFNWRGHGVTGVARMPMLLTNQSLGEARAKPGYFRAPLLPEVSTTESYFVFCILPFIAVE